jgi:ribonuclease Z
MDAPRISLFSTPLVSTWVFNETYRILFDAGDGIAALLESRIHKIKLAAITHAHRDHCAGLMQLLNLRGGAGDFATLFPTGSGSARTLTSFLATFDSRSTSKVRFHPLEVGESFPVEPERHFLRGFETDHYPPLEGAKVRSMGYQIVRHVDKLKPEFRGLPQPELDALRMRFGRPHLTETLEDVLFSITGDTMPLPPETFRDSRVLMHECTFLDVDERCALPGDRDHPHSCLSEVLQVAMEAGVGRLGLYHVSRRYEDDQILARVRAECDRMRVPFPVSVALPGRLYEDFFAQAVWQGTADAA